jgi:branched-chain amino acid aminotransferase
VTPDLAAHCARVNRSAEALMITPTVSTDDMVAIVREGLSHYPEGRRLHPPDVLGARRRRPGRRAEGRRHRLRVCLEEIPMAPADAATTLTTTRFRRPVLEARS